MSYTIVQQWQGGFQGQFTIVNNSNTAVNGWHLVAALPGDQIDSVWDAFYHVSGDSLILFPPSYQYTIAAGTSLSEHFTAQGGTTSPTSCTFNNAPC